MTALFKYRLLVFIFIISGFSGLIYESIWSHYLKLFLGHAAYAQTLVLIIFMGGMSIGAWLAARFLNKNHNLLQIYAITELIIGFLGIVFHSVFQVVIDVSLGSVIPSLSSPLFIYIYKWMTGAFMILPQSILLGATFPLMANGILRLKQTLPGHSISILYFANSIGAAIGVLVSGFYLIALVGLPGTILAAGLLNIAIAIIVYGISKGEMHPPIQVGTPGRKQIPQLLIWAAFLTGAASFIYELVWIRMLSMVLGSSTHAFELMLSAFITGLAFGGLWIRNRVDKFKNPLQVGGYIQIGMGLIAISTLALYNQTFELMGFIIEALQKNNAGYILFNLGSHAIAMLVMLPATFLAGMTLPLFTFILLEQGYGEKSISHIYVSNTLGAITGVLFVILFGFPALGMKWSMLVGGGIDLVLGIILFVYAGLTIRKKCLLVAPAMFCFLIIGIYVQLDPRLMASGVFRYGLVLKPEKQSVVYHQDGKTSTVTVIKYPVGIQSIFTNGKPDASIKMNQDTNNNLDVDEITQVMLGALPLMIHPDAETVANIGMGSGLTSHTVLTWPEIRHLDTVEIEEKMVDGAKLFSPRNDLVFNDQRSHIRIEDAKTFFSNNKIKYDVIISEPSNPWVSGVSSLYTYEFYNRINQSIKHDGYFVQWLHLYELSEYLFKSILKSIASNFNDFSIYATNDYDIIIVASVDGPVSKPGNHLFKVEAMRDILSQVGINSTQDIHARFVGDKFILNSLLVDSNIKINSDYFPILDLNAPRARFLSESVALLNLLKNSPLSLLNHLNPIKQNNHTDITPYQSYSYSILASQAKSIYEVLISKNHETAANNQVLPVEISYLVETANICPRENNKTWNEQLLYLVNLTFPYLQLHELNDLLHAIRPDGCDDPSSNIKVLWLDMLTAFINYDYPRVYQYTEQLQEMVTADTKQVKSFLTSLKLLSLYMMEDKTRFMSLYHEAAKTVYRDTLPRDIEVLYKQVLHSASISPAR